MLNISLGASGIKKSIGIKNRDQENRCADEEPFPYEKAAESHVAHGAYFFSGLSGRRATDSAVSAA
jgi:hypothetical protein